MSEENQNVELENEEKSTDPVEENNSVGEITLEQFKNALENNLEVKGYYDSLVDKNVSKRLDKGIESWKTNNLENLINEEVNKRYPQKTEAEIKFEEQQKQLECAIEEKRQLELQIKYQGLMAENNLPMDILDFVAGKDLESTISNIERFKNLTDKYVTEGVQKEVNRRLGESSYTPPGNGFSGRSGSMWD
ncbi:DUF4355 domain-containing protein [Clostridium botulinum]|uniref:DUF4355 domain-containing protein n=1 Tax=Clostridium botulinum TaxID=1491 RepID=A0A6B4JHZ7_CLOBO|nr:DUF4355 domain-containing protein [Clostridium botulinum]EES50342.1 conserved hypothetical protein [Clostridium botulinum E1 str. 'BoNT E Beluga']MBY6759857.1 DUF4355 domain-containing protein [Clostridium botulinum]MBY6918767.1 DUF4355 domain-containing protein [Clostridium botulinum]MCR1129853.1 DUF4355 domain-containing protein [Clostridium botulinum]NFJ56570.1 DUF4355 domain-containing protein [Clostridium botulinum]